MAGSLLILTGPPGAGKSTVARLVTENAPHAAVHLHTDSFCVWIRTGFVPPYLPEAARQNDVVLGVIAEAACGYARGGYDVVLDGSSGRGRCSRSGTPRCATVWTSSTSCSGRASMSPSRAGPPAVRRN
ncbi:AAA family ATPase [Amycolatopsis sp. NPDC004625]|uniref:AAA family ATPase n=1 Tax=Amycolatopsis sp. NPDC004625 TaxID=3154670 RepID=UPI0033B57C8F